MDSAFGLPEDEWLTVSWGCPVARSGGTFVSHRNRVRHELLPLLDEIAGRDVAPLLVRTGTLVAQDVAYLEELSEAIDPTDTRALATIAPVLASRALRRWLMIAHDGYVPSAAELERVMAVVRGDSVACELAGGWRVARRDRCLRLEAPPAQP